MKTSEIDTMDQSLFTAYTLPIAPNREKFSVAKSGFPEYVAAVVGIMVTLMAYAGKWQPVSLSDLTKEINQDPHRSLYIKGDNLENSIKFLMYKEMIVFEHAKLIPTPKLAECLSKCYIGPYYL